MEETGLKQGYTANNVGRGGRNREEKEGDRYPPHVRSPPTFQPWLRLEFKVQVKRET